MSGFEVAGVVLGALPLAIQALKLYKNVLSPMRSASQDLRALIQDLETEEVRLRNACEILLDGVAPLSEIDSLMQKPFGPDWERYSQKLKVRLWTSSESCRENIANMQDAALKLKGMLAIQADGKAHLTSHKAIYQEIKHNVSFTLKRKDYVDIIDRLKSGNAALYTLIQHNRELEPSRERRSQDRFVKLVRSLSQRIFKALCTATTCHCAQLHHMCLELVPRQAFLIAGDSNDQMAKDLDFHVMFTSEMVNADDGRRQSHPTPAILPLQSRGESLRIRFTGLKTVVTPFASPSAPMVLPLRQNPIPRRERLGAFIKQGASHGTTDSATSTQTKTQTQTEMKPLQPSSTAIPSEFGLISDLCQILRKSHKLPSTACYGYITEEKHEFGLYNQERNLQFDNAMTLRQMFEGQHSDLNFREKIQVALAISTGILHLYSTEWLGKPWTLDDVMLLREEHNDLSQQTTISLRPFVARHSQPSAAAGNTASTGRGRTRPLNLAVLSLGALLAQIIIGKRVEALDIPSSADVPSILMIHRIGKQLSDAVLEHGGLDCMSAVDWCFDSVLHVAGLADETYCQSFYVQVVKRLQSNSDLLENMGL